MTRPALLGAAAVVDVTPPAGHPLGGYAARVGVADGTAEPLLATLIWLGTESASDDGVLWLSLDAPAVDTVLASELATAAATVAGIDPSRVLVCASHTHSGPSGWSGCVHPAVPASRDPSLVRALVSAVAAAELNRVPVDVSWHLADVPGVGTNRHRVDGPYDATAGVLAIWGPERTPLAVLFDFACHPTVLGPDNLSWSPDWPGAARVSIAAAVRRRTGRTATLGTPVVGFLQGAAGDVSSRFTRQARDHTEVVRLGGLFATPVSRSMSTTVPVRLDVPRLTRTTVRLPIRTLPTPAEAAATLTHAHEAGEDGEGVGDRVVESRVEGARGLAAMAAADLPPHFDLPITAVSLGDLAWIHLPVEPFASVGADIVAASPFPMTRVVGYTDGYFGYLVDQETATAATTYESLITYFDASSTVRLLSSALRLLQSQHARLRR